MPPHPRPIALLLAGGLALVASCAPEAGAARPDAPAPPVERVPADGAPPALTPEGWGSLRIGMTRAEMVAILGEKANPDAVGGPDPATCDELRPAQAPEGMLVMLERGRVTRITLSAPAQVETTSGIQIGDPASEVRSALGANVESVPHQYISSPGQYLTTWTGPARGKDARGIRYEIGGDGRVLHIHAGGPSIEYVEGCV